jgi:hypothetical protein
LEVEALDPLAIGWLMAKAFPHRFIERLFAIVVERNLATFLRDVKFNA